MSGEITAARGPWALADRLVLARVSAEVLGVDRPVTIGRYRVERDLGKGGMGQVLLAFDPSLQRKVALKLIAPELLGSTEARARIVAEARAMAQLSHPNVAAVYEVDEVDGRLFVAIEFVDGVDLRRWSAERPRTWREIVDVFVQAGMGLAAAHAKGITHRDFKPENLMIDVAGRPRVVDFGLARAAGASAEHVDEAPRVVADGLTRTGIAIGTPGYMAPEQWDGDLVDARSDQFAFCVALFESIAGARPFGDEEGSAREGSTAPWPAGAPGWIHRAVLRGLAVAPAARWPDMHALLAAIDPGRRRRRQLMVVGAAGVAALATTSWLAAYDPCRGAGSAIDEVWNDGRRAEVLTAARTADEAWGERSSQAFVDTIDGRALAWRTAAEASCAVADGDSPVVDHCLAHARRRIDDVVALALKPDAATWVSAVARTEQLPEPAACAEAPPLAIFRMTPEEATRRETEVVRLLAEAERHTGALTVRGDPEAYRTAIAKGRAAIDDAIAKADDHGPLRARALLLATRLHLGEGDIAKAETTARAGSTLARGLGDAPLGAAFAVELVYAISRERERFPEAEDLAAEAGGMLDALGDPPLLRARLIAHRASAIAHAAEADHQTAVTLHEQSGELLARTLGPAHPSTIIALGNTGAALNYAERSQDAAAILETAIAAAEHTWGAEHPRTALLRGTLGLARMRSGDLVGAEHELRESLRSREATLGSDHPQVDDARFNLAMVLRRRGAHADAIVHLRVGLDNVRARLGDDDDRNGPWLVALGESQVALGANTDARKTLDEALRAFERTGAPPRDYARVRLGLGRTWRDENPITARALLEVARIDATEAGAKTTLAEIDAELAELGV